MLIKIIIFGIILQMSFAEADPKICNYKKYPKTNSEYKLQKLDVSFNIPGALLQLAMKGDKYRTPLQPSIL